MKKTVKGLLLLLLLLLLLAVLAWKSSCRVALIQATYDSECPPPVPSNATQPDWSKAVPAMKEQSGLLLNWGFALAGGIVALITTKATHPFKWRPVLFFLLGPALLLLVGSLWSAILFQRRLTYLTLKDCLRTGATLNDLLLAQSDFLQYAVWLLALFTLVCLAQIVLGVVSPDPDSKA